MARRVLFDALADNKTEIERLVRGILGFMRFSLVRTGAGAFILSGFQDKRAATRARDRISKNASNIGAAPPVVAEGAVVLQVRERAQVGVLTHDEVVVGLFAGIYAELWKLRGRQLCITLRCRMSAFGPINPSRKGPASPTFGTHFNQISRQHFRRSSDGGDMSSQISSLRSFALAVPILVWGVGLAMPANAAPAYTGNCLAAPNSPAPKGKHWYYHTDRARRRKCWFLRSLSQPTRHLTAHHFSASQDEAVKKSTLGSADAPVLTKEGIAAPPLPPLPPRRAQASATHDEKTPESVRQRVQNAAPSAPAAAAAQTGAAWPAEAEPLTNAPAAAFVWPEPPATARAATRLPTSVPSDAVAAVAPPPQPTNSPSQFTANAAAAAGNTAPAAHISKMASSSAQPFLKMLLVVVLGLSVAGLLYRLVIKFVAMRGSRVIISPSESDWSDDRRTQGQRSDRWSHAPMREWDSAPAHGSAGEPLIGPAHAHGAFIRDASLSLVPAAGDDGLHRPHPVVDRRPAIVRHGNGGASIAARDVERENKLTQLMRDLDQLLQRRKET